MIRQCLFVFAGLLSAVQAFSQNTFPFPQNGNVGIGTNNPVALLDVNGSVTLSGNTANIDNQGGGFPLSFLENSGKVIIGWNRSRGGGETSFISNQGAGYGGGFAFYNHNNLGLETRLMWVRGDGTVGIGTEDTQGYKLAVSGTIHTKEVKVDMAGWPDYVFKAAYHLQPLTAVSSFIGKNGHLPDMPSASVVEKEGVNLGEMNKLLIRKVEELTLYLIEKDKELKSEKRERIEQATRFAAALKRLESRLSEK
jgi:hypothetical protein